MLPVQTNALLPKFMITPARIAATGFQNAIARQATIKPAPHLTSVSDKVAMANMKAAVTRVAGKAQQHHVLILM